MLLRKKLKTSTEEELGFTLRDNKNSYFEKTEEIHFWDWQLLDPSFKKKVFSSKTKAKVAEEEFTKWLENLEFQDIKNTTTREQKINK